MNTPTSIITYLTVGLCILSCGNSDTQKKSLTSKTVANLKIDATNFDQNSINNLVTKNYFSTMQSVVDDDREL